MGEIVNPYIAGAPVTEQRMFFGREDVFDWIQNSLAGQYANHILVIHGQRRVGKTSVLKQLGSHLPKKYIPIFFDLQGRTHTTLDRFLWWLAREIVRVLKQDRGIEMPIPEKEAFTADAEYFENKFLASLRPILGESTLLLTFDEFDNLEESGIKEELARPLLDYLRRLMGETGMNFIFSIGSSGRKLENMQASYTEFFKTALYKKISFLSRDQTNHLVTKPVESVLEYEDAALDEIFDATFGHPYFTQLMCYEIFARCQRTEQRRVAKSDVDAIMNDVVERGTVNLKFVWDEASDLEKWSLAALAQLDKADDRALTDYLRKQRVRFSEIELTSGLLHLREKNILTTENRFVIHLLKLWLQKNRPIEQAREELTEVNPIANRYIEIGLEFKDGGIYDKAIESFQEALAIAKDNVQAQVNIALTYMDQKAYDKAIVEFEKALGMDEEDVSVRSGLCEAHLAIGDAAITRGRSKEAMLSYQRVLAINAEHSEARGRMAELSRRRAEKALVHGKNEEALSAFTEALKYTPEDTNLIMCVDQVRAEKKTKLLATLIARSEKSTKAKKWNEAIAALTEAQLLDPGNENIKTRLDIVKKNQAQIRDAKASESQKKSAVKHLSDFINALKSNLYLGRNNTSLYEPTSRPAGGSMENIDPHQRVEALNTNLVITTEKIIDTSLIENKKNRSLNADEFNNPYIVGSPVTEPRMFLGREDVFEWIQRNLFYRDPDRIMVLYGRRRVGKTSVLKQLDNRLTRSYLPIFFDLQGRTRTTFNHFLWQLAGTIARVLKHDYGINIPSPTLSDFATDSEFFETQFLPSVITAVDGRCLLIAFDEFEILEAAEIKDTLAHPLMDCLQRLVRRPGIDFIFSISLSDRNLEDTLASFTGFFRNAIHKKIGFLSKTQTYDLVVKPTEGLLEYDQEAIEYIYKITHGHPYFTQLICHELFPLNRTNLYIKIRKENVDAALLDAVEHGAFNLSFLWNEASDLEKACLTALTQLKDNTENQVLANYLRQRVMAFNEADLISVLRQLQEKDILNTENQFIIQLFKIWIEKNQDADHVFDNLNKTPITNNYMKKGLFFREKGLFKQAIDSFHEILNIDPDNIDAHVNIGYSYLALERFDDAEREFNVILLADNANKLAQTGLSQIIEKKLENMLESASLEKINCLRVFLCHSSLDKSAAYKLYERLLLEGVDPWLDKEKLLPGQEWEHEIQKAVKKSDAVIVLISRNSVTHQGYVQKEITIALDIADQQPEGAIFLIPLRLEECEVPNRLKKWQWVDYFENKGYDRLLHALHKRAKEKEIPFMLTDR